MPDRRNNFADILVFHLLFINCSAIWTRAQDGLSDCYFIQPYRLNKNNSTNITLLCGEELDISCKKDNSRWYRISKERFKSINSSEELNKMQIFSDKYLILDQLTKHDIGWYSRILSTSDNKRIFENWFYLDVICDDNNEQLYSEVQKVDNGTAPPYFAWNKYHLENWNYYSTESRVSFSCLFRGYPNPDISYLRNTRDSLPINPISNSILLEFEYNSQNGSTNYTCKACNTNGCVNHTVVFELNSKPILNEITRNVVAQVGQSVHLKTGFFSNSYPWRTMWNTNAKAFIRTTHRDWNCFEASCSFHEREFHHTSNYTDIIRLENITKEHQGFYTYYAANFRGKAEHTIHLAVVNGNLGSLTKND